jgi:hypothetical protein
MKIRNGFVSNSSSSSFVVAVPAEQKNTAISVTLTANIQDYVQDRITTKEELLEYINDNCYDPDERIYQYAEWVKFIEAGKVILAGSFSSDSGEPIESALCERGLKKEDNPALDIIQSEGGY